MSMPFSNPTLSLADLAGKDYVEAVCAARAAIDGSNPGDLFASAAEKVELFPPAFSRRMDELLPRVGDRVCRPLGASAPGAGSAAVQAATRLAAAPVAGHGLYRVGEDGRLYLASKAEHYHLSLGHSFPGYRLLENARRIGIPNATHNNTRGHITRLLEESLVAAANGIDPA